MRSFAEELRVLGHSVVYIRLDDADNTQSLTGNVFRFIHSGSYERFEYQLPDEYRLDKQLREMCDGLPVASQAFDTEHFITSRKQLGEFFAGKKYLMETYYRHIRRQNKWLMEDDKPLGGRWNYDKENRKSLPKNYRMIEPLVFQRDVRDLVDLIEAQQIQTIGTLDPEKFIWPITRDECRRLFEFFLTHCFTDYGKYQDAMHSDHWSLLHSRLSFGLNAKLISPREVINEAINFYRTHTTVGLASVEGFIRQIAGWREFMRGVYWACMPAYEGLNHLGHSRLLPQFYWTGETHMACMRHAINQSLDTAYAHHIQRLMITGNFALLAGIAPDEVDKWYLGIYIDAVQWVEITNTRGMSQYADGGLIATKPYVCSANYINKMSNYCRDCHYDHKEKVQQSACPFNALYYHFLIRNKERFQQNHRMRMMYSMLGKWDSETINAVYRRAEQYLEDVDSL